ncbi:MAG TPA: phospholipase D-like domain-containing protein [Bryobacteraceae bacterium]|nr:phospholipase D-like domain-containing protein [Bryobacteraceae bacterium]
MTRSLVVLPDDTAKPILDAIQNAAKSLRVKLFALSDPSVLEALIAARKRGVNVRVMLNPSRRSGEVQNRGARSLLHSEGVDVLDGNPAFEVTHEKSMVVDDNLALIGSLNWETENFETTRDFAVFTTDPKEVREVMDCFDADWSRMPFEAPKSSNLIWCPGNGRERIAQFVDHSTRSLYVQNERYQDAIVVEHLVRAKMRGVKVRALTRPSHSLRKEKLVEGVGDLRIMQDVGIGVRRIKHLKLHAKVLIADHSSAIVGSINLTPGTFDKRRELAIRLTDPEVVNRLWRTVREDWRHSHSVDLTDEGLLDDLSKHPKLGGLSRAGQVTTAAE